MPSSLLARSGRVSLDQRLGVRMPPAILAAGDAGVGRRLLAGQFRVSGRRVSLAAGASCPWGLVTGDPALADQLHRFGWLDDLTALGGTEARLLARRWTDLWMLRYARRRRDSAWRADVAGLRLLSLLRNAPLLLDARPLPEAAALTALMVAHLGHLARRADGAPAGQSRLAALVALLTGSLCLPEQGHHITLAQAALGRHCAQVVEPDGGMASRNPEALAACLGLLVAARAALLEAGLAPDPAHEGAVARMAGCLRSLRHAGGGLARFHGGGSGNADRIDVTLAALDFRPRVPTATAMGFARLAAGRTTVIVDVLAPPPAGAASMLAFEVSSGRRGLIASRGAFGSCGPHWAHAGRAPDGHAAVCIDGLAPARDTQVEGRAEPSESAAGGVALVFSHDGYAASHGLTHVRRLELSRDGRALAGADMLLAVDTGQRQRLQARLGALDGPGLRAALRFPLHPDAQPRLDLAARCVRIALPNGEHWDLTCHEGATPTLEPAVFLVDTAGDAVRQTWQVVFSCELTGPGHQIVWTLAKSGDTPVAVRDVSLAAAAAAAPADDPPDPERSLK